jgi:hypothetical protein
MILLIILISAVLCMSRYAEDRKAEHQENAQGSSPNLVISPNGNGQSAQNANKPHQHPSWIDTFAWPEGATAWALFLTLLVIAWQSTETRAAASAADRQADIASDTAKRQLRAYMVVRNSRLILHEDGSVEPKMELANCGQTPAYDLRGATHCRFTKYPIQKLKPIPEDLRQSQSNIGAGLAFYLLPPGGRHDGGDREHLIRKLSADGGDLVYCANGYFTYRDVFKGSHWLKFQLIVGGPSGVRLDSDATGQQWASFCNDSEGNEQD